MSNLHVQLEYLHAMEIRTGCRFCLRAGYNHGAPWVELDGYHLIELWIWSPREPSRSYLVSDERIGEYDETIGHSLIAGLLDTIESYMLDHPNLIPTGAPILNDSIWRYCTAPVLPDSGAARETA